MDINCKKKIQSVKLNLQNGQVEIILRALELYKYNLNYMLDTEQCSDTERQKKLAMVQFTFEQVLSIQAEQVNEPISARRGFRDPGRGGDRFRPRTLREILGHRSEQKQQHHNFQKQCQKIIY